MYYSEEGLFYNRGNRLSDFLTSRRTEISRVIKSENEEYILNVGQEQYIEHLVERFTLDILAIIEDGIFAEDKEENIPANQFSQSFYVHAGKSYLQPVLYYTMPFSGDKELFRLLPSTYTVSPPTAQLKDGKIIKRFIAFNNDFEGVQGEFDSFKRSIMNYIGFVNKDIESYNNSLKPFIELTFENRKGELLKRKQLLAGITVPIKKKDNVSGTFAIPNVNVKKKITVKPTVTTRAFSPDPTLAETTYNDILTLINDMGKEFERKPSVYTSKGEEDLRDHFLMLLEPHFEGSATGETFNKTGKTDILLRYEGNNVFVGECKFWTGEKGFLKTIDQLLGYLTWRDSKTSVIMFVRNKEFTNVIETVKRVTETHSNFVKFVNEKDHSWFNYIFHLNEDKNKEIKLAIMLYHIH